MKTFKYRFSFFGRQQGAIGINYDISQEYEAATLEEACTKLWVDYSPVRNIKLDGKPFKFFDPKLLDHKQTLKTYKGLGMLRK